MDNSQLKLLSKMKKLILNGKRHFIIRKDRDYLTELLEIGISEQEAWNEILSLSSSNYIINYKPYYLKSDNSLIFKKAINKNLVYIKIKIELNDLQEMVVCLSFHIDHK
jgi:hypothetical protein